MENIKITTGKNIKLSAVFNNLGGKNCVIMCHGIKGEKTEKGNFILLEEKLNKSNISSLRFDFRAHGESEGDFIDLTIRDEIEDVHNVIEFIMNFGYENIILVGASFGGSVISMLDFTKYHQIKALVLWYPALRYDTSKMFSPKQFEDAEKFGYIEMWNSSKTKLYKFGREFLRERKELKPWLTIINCKLPKLFLHGNCDTNTSIDDNSIYASKLSPNSKLIILNGLDHCFIGDEHQRELAINSSYKFIIKQFKNRKNN